MRTTLDEHHLLAWRRHPLAAEVARGLARGEVPLGARVVIAASGGADSSALLAVCAGLRERGRIEPAAAHVDHGLRPESSLDKQCVHEQGQRLGVHVLERTLKLTAGPGLPERARDARYVALAEMAAEWGADLVLAAHHADDQFETMLLSLARGAGLGGVAGMPVRRTLPAAAHAADGIWLVRPCLRISRAQLRAACSELGVFWREDPGNDRRDTPRGLMRHVVIPALDSVSSGAAVRAARTAEFARVGHALTAARVAQITAGDGSIPREHLQGSPDAFAATAIWLMVGEELSDSARWSAAEAALDDSTDPRRFPLASGGELLVDAHGVRVSDQGTTPVAVRQRS